MAHWNDKLPDHPRIVIWNGVSDPRQMKTKSGRDKISMREQSSTGHAFLEKMNGVLVHEFFWEGESRWESDLEKALEDFKRKKWMHYHMLRDMWRDKGFDILHCYHHSRLGRSFTLQSWVVENIARSDMLIYEHLGGWIDEDNYPGKIAINGFSNVSEIRRFTHLSESARRERPRRGLHTTKLPPSHVVEYDPLTGEQVRLHLNPDTLPMLDALGDLVIARLGWNKIPKALTEQGYISPTTGKQYHASDLHRTMYNPLTWGHIMESNLHSNTRHAEPILSRIDPTMPQLPDDIIHFNKTEAVYTGAKARRILAELHRQKSMDGGARSGEARMFSGLCLCAECLHQMRTTTHAPSTGGKRYTYIQCVSGIRNRTYGTYTPCSNSRSLRYDRFQPLVHTILEQCIADEGGIEKLFNAEDVDHTALRLSQVETEVSHLEKRIRSLITQSADASSSLTEFYGKALKEEGTKLDTLRAEMTKLRATRSDDKQQQEYRAQALIDIGPLDAFWQRSEGEINQLLHAFFIDYRFYVLDREVVRLAPMPPKV